jgi:MFS family permease
MFGLSPLSGRLTDRFGVIPVILAGMTLTAFSSALAAVAPPDGGLLLFIALFLLGYGWNLGYVAGSALLTHGLSLAERTRLQGLTDAFVWSTGAVASMSSGIVASVAGYTALGIGGLGLVMLLAFVVWGGRQRLVAPA